MKVSFWLLDIDSHKPGPRPQVRLWGIDEGGRRVLLIDKNFLPRFYVVPKNNNFLSALMDKCSRIEGVAEVKPVRRRFLGRELMCVEVLVKDPSNMDRLAKKISNLEIVMGCYGYDVRYTMQYLILKNLPPCKFIEVEASPTSRPEGAQIDLAYEIVGEFKPSVIEEPPELRTLSFYCVIPGEKGSPDPKSSPVVMISVITPDDEIICLEAGDGDSDLLKDFCDVIRSSNPDVIFGYGTNKRDWIYLVERAKINGIKLPVGRTGLFPHTSAYGHVSVTGRANLDLLDFVEDIQEIKLKTLQNAADYLGVMSENEGPEILEYDLYDYWSRKREILRDYAQHNVMRVKGLGEEFLDFGIQLSQVVGLPLDHVAAAAVGFRVEWFLIKEAVRRGELVPPRKEAFAGSYVGGIVLKPEPGVHEDIAVLDFASMYPNIMMLNNISPDTYIPPDEPDPPQGCYVAPGVGHRFRKEPPGLYREILSELIRARREVKEKLKSLQEDSPYYRVLQARQRALKVIANATYGYTGWAGARWYLKPVAEATAAWGRHYLRSIITMAEEAGFRVIYGDTDSIFIRYREGVDDLLNRIEKKLSLDIKLEKIYQRIIFTEAKKKYAGVLEDGTIDLVGLECVRGDWPDVARKAQREIVRIVLTTREIREARQRAKAFIRKYVEDVRNLKVPLKDFTIWKEITKKEYKARTPHLKVTEDLRRMGWKIKPGDKVGYVVVKGSGKLYERSVPFFKACPEDIDIDYYIDKMIFPAVMRILKLIGVEESELKGGGLEEFL